MDEYEGSIMRAVSQLRKRALRLNQMADELESLSTGEDRSSLTAGSVFSSDDEDDSRTVRKKYGRRETRLGKRILDAIADKSLRATDVARELGVDAGRIHFEARRDWRLRINNGWVNHSLEYQVAEREAERIKAVYGSVITPAWYEPDVGSSVFAKAAQKLADARREGLRDPRDEKARKGDGE